MLRKLFIFWGLTFIVVAGIAQNHWEQENPFPRGNHHWDVSFTDFSSTVQNIEVQDPDPNRFRGEIETFTCWDQKNSFPSKALLFIGSSSIRLWSTHLAFPEYPVINRGFGGAQISDINYFYDQLVKKYQPSVIVFYAGDNDVAAGKGVQQVYNDYIGFVDRLKRDFPGIKLIYLPIKPSINRWNFWTKMKKVNKLIQDFNEQDDNLYYVDTATPMLGEFVKPRRSLFLEDGLHLNQSGYELWESLLSPYLEQAHQYVKK